MAKRSHPKPNFSKSEGDDSSSSGTGGQHSTDFQNAVDEDGVPLIVDTQSDLEKSVEQNKIPIVAALCLIMLGSAGWFMYKNGRDKKALESSTAYTIASSVDEYNEVIDDFGGSIAAGNAYLSKAQAMIDEGRTDEAHQVLWKFIGQYEDHPRHAQAYLAYGTVQEQAGKPDGANAEYENLIKKYPQSELAPYARIRQGDLKWAAGDIDGAADIYKTIAANYPRTGQTWVRKIEQRFDMLGIKEEADGGIVMQPAVVEEVE